MLARADADALPCERTSDAPEKALASKCCWAIMPMGHARFYASQPPCTVPPPNSARVALFRFSIFLFNSIHCKFKNLYKFDLKSEKYERNFIE
jgi:hypothetical protein